MMSSAVALCRWDRVAGTGPLAAQVHTEHCAKVRARISLAPCTLILSHQAACATPSRDGWHASVTGKANENS